MSSRSERRQPLRPRAGFVLMEAVVALAIIGTVAVALLAATAVQVRSADRAARLLTAQALAEERMAVARSLSWQELRSPPDSITRGSFPDPFADYAWQIDVAPVEDEYDLFNVTVEVAVQDHAYRMTTLLHEPQPQLEMAAPARGRRP